MASFVTVKLCFCAEPGDTVAYMTSIWQGAIARRVADAERLFRNLCTENRWALLFGSNASWAIVGGAVRDALLSSRMETSWPDIDIAVARSLDALPVVNARRRSALQKYRISYNSYGGLKIASRAVPDVDVWSWTSPGESRTALRHWQQRLELVDFGLNAVAFVWPQAKIIVHPRWQADLDAEQVEVLADPSSLRGIQVVRSVALATKASKLISKKVELGVQARAELRWLVSSAPQKEVSCALNYLRQKVDSGRWDRSVERNFFELCSEYLDSDIFWSCVLGRSGMGRLFTT